DPGTIVGPMISPEHQKKVARYIELGQQESARMTFGGGTPDLPAHLKNGNWIQPTVFADVDKRMKIAQDEIFGPVPCLIPFATEDDALRIANDTPYGLSSYIWTESTGRALRMGKGIEA